MWERWQKGESLHQIAQLFGRDHSSVQRILAERGGIRPAPRCRSKVALTLAEREEISSAMVAGHSMRSVATRLGRAPSTVSRESIAMVGEDGIEPVEQTRRPGIRHVVPRPVSWLRIDGW